MKANQQIILFIVGALTLKVGSAVPVTDINKLPSITVDTLYPTVPPADNEQSESVGYFVRNMLLGHHMFQNQIRPRQEATYVTLFRLPWRIARSVSQTGYGVAKTFMGTFAQQFMESYNHMQKQVIPQASQAYAVWANPPQPNVETPWLDGGV